MEAVSARAAINKGGMVNVIPEYYHVQFCLGYNPEYGTPRHLPSLRVGQHDRLDETGEKATLQSACGGRVHMPAMSSVEAVLVLQPSP